MNAETTLDKFKKFMKDNKQHLYESAIDASEIRSDDEWMKEDIWDKIYQKEEKKQYRHVFIRKEYQKVRIRNEDNNIHL